MQDYVKTLRLPAYDTPSFKVTSNWLVYFLHSTEVVPRDISQYHFRPENCCTSNVTLEDTILSLFMGNYTWFLPCQEPLVNIWEIAD